MVDLFFALIGSELIDPEKFPRVLFKGVYRLYPNRKYRFSSPAGLWKAATRVIVDCNYLLKPIDLFHWSKISFKFFTQEYFRWLLTFVYWIYWIIVHWPRNFYLGVIENCMWDVYKTCMHICPPYRFVEGCGEGTGFVLTIFIINWLTGFKAILEDRVGNKHLIVQESCWNKIQTKGS